MAKNDPFRDFVLEQLGHLPDVSWRPMFGGTGLYSSGTFFGIISDGRVYFRVDDTTRPAYEARGMGLFCPSDDFESKKYFEVPPEVLENPRELCVWAQQAVQAKLGVKID